MHKIEECATISQKGGAALFSVLKRKFRTLFILIDRFFKACCKRMFEAFCMTLPVKRNKIIFSSFCGKSYSCNQRAIYEYIEENYPGRFKYVWVFDYASNPVIPDALKKKAKLVQHNSKACDIQKATSGVWCFNHRNTSYFHKKKSQFYIQTWHGNIGFKGIDKMACKTVDYSSPYIQKCIVDSKMIDIIPIGSEFGLELMMKSFFYDGEYLKAGYPRNDILIKGDPSLKKSVLARYALPEDTKILVYAPTFRETFKLYDPLFSDESAAQALISALKKRFGGSWVIFVKYHPACIYEKQSEFDGKALFNVTDFGDIADLLVACDAFVSDYSSSVFDFMLTRKPCWLFVPDLDTYISADRNIVIDLDDVRLPMCKDVMELAACIEAFDSAAYGADVDEMLKTFGSYDKGGACKAMAEKINDFIGGRA